MKTEQPYLPFSDLKGPIFENQRTIAHLERVTEPKT